MLWPCPSSSPSCWPSLRAAVRDRSDLVAENLLLRHQLAVLTRPTRRRPRLRTRDRLLWVLARRLRRDWRRHLVLVRPETVVRWHRQAWRLFWRWRSRTRRAAPAEPGGARADRRMARDNPLWGTERIRGELLKLGLAVSNRSIRRYRGRRPPRRPSQTWRTFLRNHAHTIWAADLFTVQTLTFRTLYVLLFITHGRRELVHVERHRAPDGGVGVAPAGRGHRLGPPAAAPGAGPGRRLRRRLRRAGEGAGHRDGPHAGAGAAGERDRRAGRADPPQRVPRPRDPARRGGTCARSSPNTSPTTTPSAPTGAWASSRRLPRARPTAGPIRARPVLGGLHHVYQRAA